MHDGSRKAGLIIGSILAVSLLFNSVVYACSKIGMAMAMHGFSMATTGGMDGRSVERGPCAKHKQDICKSVRDRLLSTQPTPYKLDPAQQLISVLLPSNVAAEVPIDMVMPLGALEWQTAFHSVFKLPLPLSFLVLRI